MDAEIKRLVDQLIEKFNKYIDNWFRGTYVVIANSGESVSYSAGPNMFDVNDTKLSYQDYLVFVPDYEFNNWIVKYLKELNSTQKVNTLTFLFDNKMFISLQTEWNQIAHEESIKYYSKVKLEKMRAWYLPEEGIPPVKEVKQVLPKAGVSLDTSSLTLDKAIFELNKVVTYKDDPLWDGGFYSIKKNKDGWSGDADLYLFDSLESKEKNWEADQVSCDLEITKEMQQLFLYIQEQYAKINPSEIYDTLFVTVQRDGIRYVTNFELEGEEVYPTAPPKPETINAAYLCQNLHNCLAHNAPDTYKWVWEILKRTQTSDGKTQMEGDFYYSLLEDKSNPQRLEPGEYIYMYNVSERLFDEFFLEETKGWSEIALYFSKEGKASFKMIRK